MTVIVPRQPQAQPIGVPTADRSPDPLSSTPRAVLPRAVVAAAVASIPTLSPVLAQHEPEYCLSTKRKASDVVDDSDPDAPRTIKKVKNDQQEPLFGTLTTPPQADAPQEQSVFDIAIEQAIAAALYVFPPGGHAEAAPIAVDEPSPVHQLAIDYPSHVHSPLEHSAFGDVLPENVVAQTWQEASVAGFFSDAAPSQPVAGPSNPVIPPPVVALEGVDMVHEQPQTLPQPEATQALPTKKPKHYSLWAIACRERVETVKSLCGGRKSWRKILGQPLPDDESVARQEETQNDSSKASGSRSDASKDLQVKIYTPSTFSSDDDEDDEAEREASESELEEEADMSFDLDWDSDSDADDDESNGDPNAITPDEHETIMDVVCEQADTPSLPLSSPPPETPSTSVPPKALKVSSEAKLPHLSAFPSHNVREWIMPQLQRGTSRRVHPSHRGVLSRDHLRAAAQRDRELWRAMWQ